MKQQHNSPELDPARRIVLRRFDDISASAQEARDLLLTAYRTTETEAAPNPQVVELRPIHANTMQNPLFASAEPASDPVAVDPLSDVRRQVHSAYGDAA